jgi:hypothetical protein
VNSHRTGRGTLRFLSALAAILAAAALSACGGDQAQTSSSGASDATAAAEDERPMSDDLPPVRCGYEQPDCASEDDRRAVLARAEQVMQATRNEDAAALCAVASDTLLGIIAQDQGVDTLDTSAAAAFADCEPWMADVLQGGATVPDPGTYELASTYFNTMSSGMREARVTVVRKGASDRSVSGSVSLQLEGGEWKIWQCCEFAPSGGSS